jgi:hypothetical protein
VSSLGVPDSGRRDPGAVVERHRATIRDSSAGRHPATTEGLAPLLVILFRLLPKSNLQRIEEAVRQKAFEPTFADPSNDTAHFRLRNLHGKTALRAGKPLPWSLPRRVIRRRLDRSVRPLGSTKTYSFMLGDARSPDRAWAARLINRQFHSPHLMRGTLRCNVRAATVEPARESA